MNNKEYILITGATSGIGYEMAKIYLKNNENIILVARNLEKMNEIKLEYPNNIEIIQADLSKENEAKRVYDEVKLRKLDVKTVINNAGVGLFGDFKNTKIEDEISMINLNVISLVSLTKFFLKDMLEKNRGEILNVSSVAGYTAGPKMAVYYATKNFVTAFSNAINYELKDSNVKVSSLAPGATKTGFVKAAKLENSKLFDNLRLMEAKEVAEIAIKNLGKKREIIPGFFNKLSVFSNRLLPRTLMLKIINKIQENK